MLVALSSVFRGPWEGTHHDLTPPLFFFLTFSLILFMLALEWGLGHPIKYTVKTNTFYHVQS